MKYQISSIKYQAISINDHVGIIDQISMIKYQLFSFNDRASFITYQTSTVSSIKCQVSSIKYQVSSILHQLASTKYIVSNISIKYILKYWITNLKKNKHRVQNPPPP